jgi:hypothetical protein
MRPLLNVEYEILGTLYFTETYHKIIEEVNYPENIVAASLRFLIENKLIAVLVFDETEKKLVKTLIYDKDNLQEYSFVATRLGLNMHLIS